MSILEDLEEFDDPGKVPMKIRKRQHRQQLLKATSAGAAKRALAAARNKREQFASVSMPKVKLPPE